MNVSVPLMAKPKTSKRGIATNPLIYVLERASTFLIPTLKITNADPQAIAAVRDRRTPITNVGMKKEGNKMFKNVFESTFYILLIFLTSSTIDLKSSPKTTTP